MQNPNPPATAPTDIDSWSSDQIQLAASVMVWMCV